ncbi:hypothetical protein [Enhygromyxa salina]|uniref:HEAT repeat domain-containing protein n=1 Tax=Enhygromyxa salina TaxID=215803 RepID=A0A2S9YV91_9BACT|nr:hypothetical protein [Enhygromyxa salina]PRQ09025.1 hypothetical protein ENSA7_12960 [Enhygromyxa salina]
MKGKKKETPPVPPGWMTLAEHHAYLKEHGLYEPMLEAQRQREAEIERYQAELRQAETPVIEAVAKVGVEVERVWDLQSLNEPHPEVVQILLDHIQKPYRSEVLEDIGRALAVPGTRALWPTLVKLYKQATDRGAKEGLAVALREHGIKDRQLVDDVIPLIKDPRNGPSRLYLIDVLTRSRQPHAKQVLVELRDDPDLYKEIAVRLKRFEQSAKRRKKTRKKSS